MTEASVMQILTQAFLVAARVAGPVLVVSMVIGVVVSLLQTVTQIQDYTFSFVPKLLGVAVVLALGGHWMLNELTAFTSSLYSQIPRLLGLG